MLALSSIDRRRYSRPSLPAPFHNLIAFASELQNRHRKAIMMGRLDEGGGQIVLFVLIFVVNILSRAPGLMVGDRWTDSVDWNAYSHRFKGAHGRVTALA